MDNVHTFDIPLNFKEHLIAWLDTFDTCILFDSNTSHTENNQHSSWDLLAGAGALDFIEANSGSAFDKLKLFHKKHASEWLFGYLTYDLKNEIEELESTNIDGLKWPELFFFQPEITLGIKGGRVVIFTEKSKAEIILNAILATQKPIVTPKNKPVQLQSRIDKKAYLDAVHKIKNHIAKGDVYELNYCQEFFAHTDQIQPIYLFQRLNKIAKAPFSVFLKRYQNTLLCASPERFLKKTGQRIITQPIKGTRRRSANALEDVAIKTELANSEKDKSENIMIVDLVRNDLAKNCLPGSVEVEELCQIYSFPTVHQMISTVSGTIPLNLNTIKVIKDAFPMGSMTGAPKVMAMRLIEEYEETKRGLYSGAVGYFSPDADFDFNVVIRSLQYNAVEKYLSCSVGGAIVYESDPELEYEECLIKLSAVQSALSGL